MKSLLKTGADDPKTSVVTPSLKNNIKLLNGIRVRVFFGKNIEKNTCAVMIRIIITFANQTFLQLIDCRF